MALVGYSDTFESEDGLLGGFILKNSWWDGLPPSPTWTAVSHQNDSNLGDSNLPPADAALAAALAPIGTAQKADTVRSRHVTGPRLALHRLLPTEDLFGRRGGALPQHPRDPPGMPTSSLVTLLAHGSPLMRRIRRLTAPLGVT